VCRFAGYLYLVIYNISFPFWICYLSNASKNGKLWCHCWYVAFSYCAFISTLVKICVQVWFVVLTSMIRCFNDLWCSAVLTMDLVGLFTSVSDCWQAHFNCIFLLQPGGKYFPSDDFLFCTTQLSQSCYCWWTWQLIVWKEHHLYFLYCHLAVIFVCCITFAWCNEKKEKSYKSLNWSKHSSPF